MSKKKYFAFVLFVCFFISHIYSLPQVFNNKLSAQEKEKLENGQTVIRKLKSTKEFSLSSSNEGVQKALQIAKKLKPAYLAEIITVCKYEGNENLIEKFQSNILDVEQYAGIPYYSERNGTWHKLYDSATIKSSQNLGKTKKVNADLEMSPFGVINTDIETSTEDTYFFYTSTNRTPLKYDGINCVSEQKMKCIVTIFREGDYWVLYGIGAVAAPSIFFMRDRIETSFINRIKTFCSYFFKKLL